MACRGRKERIKSPEKNCFGLAAPTGPAFASLKKIFRRVAVASLEDPAGCRLLVSSAVTGRCLNRVSVVVGGEIAF